MRERKPYLDYYTDVKRTPAMSGPWRRKINWENVAGWVLAVLMGLAGASILFVELSK